MGGREFCMCSIFDITYVAYAHLLFSRAGMRPFLLIVYLTHVGSFGTRINIEIIGRTERG